ncbi:MAG: polyprenyl synthetase family protein [Alphaproteobacteria bacterium]|nr:polyprenyl synthetase family protein [Alphaproteobacteria bacterium]MCD8519934.1 polyprenyl synthetase family protein [Alphaproteobacteria bacterium]MCD8525694.1 polyprenyl synthetase family protein [Alphaproteobacteria bacterium]MCD8570683.1 polyprenyl synthetase family protein [Alphaproteobacteria bacterium]
MPSPAQKPALQQTPLDHILAALESDMDAVNTLILTRMESPVPLIKQLATYLIAAGGKRVRPLLTLASTALYSGDMKRAHLLAACVEFIHTATLLHDDVVDESRERRGKESANVVFGNQASVLVGDFLFSRAFQLMTEDGSIEVLRILSDASATIAEGEVLQLSVAGQIDMPMDTYIQVITGKTAALFAAAVEVGPVIADAGSAQQQAMRDFGLNLGIAFQIADDVLDYRGNQAKIGKTVGDDFREGKLTAPVLYALQNASDEERAFWARVMTDKDQQADDLKQALALIDKHDGIGKGLALAASYAQKAKYALTTMPDSPLRAQLSDLVDYMVNRDF